jgi:hypothetical protein
VTADIAFDGDLSDETLRGSPPLSPTWDGSTATRHPSRRQNSAAFLLIMNALRFRAE